MAVPLLVMLIGVYLALGLAINRYSSRGRLLLLLATVSLPAWFYFFW
jgi:hypothetical protein